MEGRGGAEEFDPAVYITIRLAGGAKQAAAPLGKEPVRPLDARFRLVIMPAVEDEARSPRRREELDCRTSCPDS